MQDQWKLRWGEFSYLSYQVLDIVLFCNVSLSVTSEDGLCLFCSWPTLLTKLFSLWQIHAQCWQPLKLKLTRQYQNGAGEYLLTVNAASN